MMVGYEIDGVVYEIPHEVADVLSEHHKLKSDIHAVVGMVESEIKTHHMNKDSYRVGYVNAMNEIRYCLKDIIE